MSIGEIRADMDAVATVLDQLAGSHRTESQEIRDAAATLSRTGKDSNRWELSDAVTTPHLAAQQADPTATSAAEAGRLCSAYAWQL